MNSKKAKEIFELSQNYMRDCFMRHPECKKKFLNYLKSQDAVTNKPEYYLRNLIKNTSASEQDLLYADYKQFLK